MKKALTILTIVNCSLFIANCLHAQGSNIPLNAYSYHLLDRLEIKGELTNAFHSSAKPYNRKFVGTFIDSLDEDIIIGSFLSNIEGYDLKYLEIENKGNVLSKKPILKHFYRNKSDFLHVDTKDFSLKINPVFYLQYGREGTVNEYINTRGIEARGIIDKKIGFYAFITENQALHPLYVQQRIIDDEAVPGQGFYKSFKNGAAVDYLEARGYIDFGVSKHVGVQFGHDKHFIGNGYRSLMLSDFSNNYLFLKLNTKIWKINYQNLFAQLKVQYKRGFDTLLTNKYIALHHLSWNATKWLNIGLFEAIVYGRKKGVDLNYFNPIIFYRALEQDLGSPDNAFVGLDYKVNFLRQFSLYGQVLLDEFNFAQIKDSSGWWGNKFGMQIGLKYIDVAGISNLDWQLEYNAVRPYTYTHRDPQSNYTHYNQQLAHPLGANFGEFIEIIRYQPLPKVNLTAKIIYAVYGADSSGSNWGGNIFLDYNTFEREYNNVIGQGVKTSLALIDLTLSYQWKHNIYFDLRYVYRGLDSDLNNRDTNANFVSLAFRMNISQLQFDF
ncbi:MAG: hypothetical protein IIA88_07245 [Bacteroidetes bacterium]|nr:hypothetical protein [Bacteroidota bacterium]